MKEKKNELIFQFKQKENMAGKPCVFELENLLISEEDIEFEVMGFTIDGKDYDGEFSSFVKNHVDTEDVFEGILNAYLRNDWEDIEFISGWSVFDDLKSRQKYDGDLLTEFPQVSYIDIMQYVLELAVEERRYYRADYDYVCLLNSGGAILTDMDGFYENALLEDTKAIEKGTLKRLDKQEVTEHD